MHWESVPDFGEVINRKGNDLTAQPQAVAETKPIRIDIGCGKNKRKDGEWIGVDVIQFDGVDVACNLSSGAWPWETDSVDEANCSHFLEHLTNLNDKWERVHFFNELYRVLKPGAKCILTLPHWCSNRYYGDPTHKEPFSEMGFYYLSREWRNGDAAKGIMANAPHADKKFNPHGYDCNFVATWGYGLNPAIQSRNTEYQTFALQNYKEAATDMIATLVKA
jgi:SAM-dependent methyltransferase